MAGSLLLLLDDITTVLDDVAVLTKVAAKKTAGVLGDDLALNAQQVTGVDATRELPVVWAVAKGSAINKSILVPAALVLSVAAPWAIVPLLIVGGLFLCFEGCEKLLHKWLHHSEAESHEKELQQAVADPAVDLKTVERDKIKGAIRTDFVLSAEIIVITLGTVTESSFATKCAVLIAISILMTIGVYGLVAAIVKLDDLGLRLIRDADPTDLTAGNRIGQFLLWMAPYLMKTLSIVGTIAMFLVGGGILVHNVPPLHHALESFTHAVAGSAGSVVASIGEMGFNGLAGLIGGAIVLIAVEGAKRLKPAKA
ncbi:DUF808 domain-containing protein [Neorhodopirellula pilleata]|uniref:Inner membrane protein YedI n=1 Tax=Neorhodopirellula pilleata TaxID=2714738 RepID=A0A5C6A1B6_9BACT|nr:DUF808 domain-containing protein [Neorhodopirellula pilleata]TWT93622.1 Inner membrane protein YedI [Neorhodopirellula pilleata]